MAGKKVCHSTALDKGKAPMDPGSAAVDIPVFYDFPIGQNPNGRSYHVSLAMHNLPSP